MWYLVLGVAATLSACLFRWVVPPYRSLIMRNRFTGAVWMVAANEAVWWIPFVHVCEASHHFRSWYIPTTGAKITIDPPEWHIITNDNVRGTLDVRVIVEIGAWSMQDLLRSEESLEKTAKTIIQTWIADTVSTMTAAEVSNYNTLNTRLNSTACHAAINAELRNVYMSIVRVSLDKGGIQLSAAYTKRLENEMELDAERAIATKKFELKSFEDTQRQSLEKKQATHAAEIQSIENDSLQKKLGVLPADKYVDLEIGTQLAKALASTKASNVVFGQNPMSVLVKQ